MTADAHALGPVLGPMLEMHRGPDGWIRFSRLSDSGAILPIASFKTEDLQRVFPEFREELAQDSYFSVNAFYWGRTARNNDLRYLNVCYSDLDYYKAGTDAGAAFAAVKRAQDEGAIPPASIIANSGRGLWLFWLLKSPTEPGMPERVFRQYLPEKLRRYRRVQMALHKALKRIEPSLEPDPRAIGPSRLAPVPGTIKSANNRPVVYDIQFDALGRGYDYTLAELEKQMRAPPGEPVEARQLMGWGGEKRIPANRRGYVALHRGRMADLETLWETRRGFRQGHREAAAWIYALALRGNRDSVTGDKMPEAEIEELVTELARDCVPPLEPDRAVHQVRASRDTYLLSDAEIIRRLEITETELEQLSNILADRPPRHKPGPKGPKPKEIKAERQAAIVAIIEERGDQPSTRKMAEFLAERGIEATYRTVARDYHELALTGPQLEITYESAALQITDVAVAISPTAEPYPPEVSASAAPVVAEVAERLTEEIPEAHLEALRAKVSVQGQLSSKGLAAWLVAYVLEIEVYRPSDDGSYQRVIGRPEMNVTEEIEKLLAGDRRPEIIAAAVDHARNMLERLEPARDTA